MSIFSRGRQETAAKIERLKKAAAEADRADAIYAREHPLPPARKPEETSFVEAEYGVPHCKYERTAEGFKVSFNKTSLAVYSGLNAAAGNMNGLGQTAGSLAGASLIGAFALAKKAGAGTNIEVTLDAVIIDGKKMHRADFGHFHVAKTQTGKLHSNTLAVLGYSYGNQSFNFGGAWDEKQANEVAAALNSGLRDAPMAGNQGLSPDRLRASRPTEF